MLVTSDRYVPQVPVAGASPHDAPALSSYRSLLSAWSVVAVGAVSLFGVIMLAPFAAGHGQTLLAQAIYKIFSFLCHQAPARSFYLHDHPYAVCARCWGVYAGVAAGIVLYPLLRSLEIKHAPPRLWLLVAALPTTIDFLLGFTGMWSNTHPSRALTGALLGVVAAFYIVPGAMELIAQCVQAVKRKFFITR